MVLVSKNNQALKQSRDQLIESIKKIGVPTIFSETTINPALIKTVAQEVGVKLVLNQLDSDSIGTKVSPGDSYIKMMETNTRSIVEALGENICHFN